MLEELRIRGLGVIDEAVLPLGPGLTVVTGETGAGKTMVVTGLLLLFGGRADAAAVRSGAARATVDGRLRLAADSPARSRVADAGGELDPDGGLSLRRVVGANGRSRAHVGGAPAPIGVLGELAERLVAVHGQADQLRLARPGEQRAALDRFAGADVAPYAAAHDRWRGAVARLAERASRARELAREADLLRHGVAEIDAADPLPGEDGELAALAGRLAHADALRLATRLAHDALLGDPDDPAGDAADVAALLGAARRALAQHADADPALAALGGRIDELAALSADVGAELAEYADGLDADPARLAAVEQRRAVLTGLIRKYADEPVGEIAGVLAWRDAAARRLADLDVSEEALAALAAERDAAAAAAARLAGELSAAREAGAERLAAAVTAELAGLAMPSARLEVRVRPRAPVAGAPVLTVAGVERAATADGVDEVEFLLQPHPDAPALPLARGASGGELSRVMLAVEVCLVGTDPVPTLVFDEVDAGVGGRAAVEVGRRLARLAAARQVIVVTHLAQVAAFADCQVVVDKHAGTDPAHGVTRADVRVVGGDDRIGELARMLAGDDSPLAREHAAELVANCAAARVADSDPAARTPTGRRARPPGGAGGTGGGATGSRA
ncbi:MAG: DNA repair protein RecN [Actinomycetia bacterium]|nr:DNA repair protein RecN [Actinomycetes bacterium]